MTTYETTARPIRTVEDLDAAVAAGAYIEFSACMNMGPGSDTYANARMTEGWIDTSPDLTRRRIERGDAKRPNYGWRAFYPIGTAPEQAEQAEEAEQAEQAEPVGEWVRCGDDEVVPEHTRVRLVSVDASDVRAGLVVGDEGVTKDRSAAPWVYVERLGFSPALGSFQLERFVPAQQESTPDERVAADWAAPDDATIGAEVEHLAGPELSPGPAQPPRFRIVVTIEADTQGGYVAALVSLVNGWNGGDA